MGLLFRILSASEVLLAKVYFKIFKLPNREYYIRQNKILKKLIHFEMYLNFEKYHWLLLIDEGAWLEMSGM